MGDDSILGQNAAVDKPLDKKYRKLLLYSRLYALTALYYSDKDGMLYESLRKLIDVSEGTLNPAMSLLKNMDLIRPQETVNEGKRVLVYYITSEGKLAYNELTKWLKTLLEIKETKEDENGSNR